MLENPFPIPFYAVVAVAFNTNNTIHTIIYYLVLNVSAVHMLAVITICAVIL